MDGGGVSIAVTMWVLSGVKRRSAVMVAALSGAIMRVLLQHCAYCNGVAHCAGHCASCDGVGVAHCCTAVGSFLLLRCCAMLGKKKTICGDRAQ